MKEEEEEEEEDLPPWGPPDLRSPTKEEGGPAQAGPPITYSSIEIGRFSEDG